MPYEIIPKKKTRSITPFVSFSARGRVGLNQAATVIMENSAVEFVLLLWDKERNRVAIRPITKKDSRAYRLARAKSSSMVHAKSFMEQIHYNSDETKTFPAEWNESEGLLEIDIPVECLNNSRAKK
jgi:hypothetical protein